MQGVCAADAKETQAPENLLRIWIHENQRVFGDRMINESDKNVLLELLLTQCGNYKLKSE